MSKRIETLESLKKMYETYRNVAFKHITDYYPKYILMDPFVGIEDYYRNFNFNEFDANCIECYNSLEIMKRCLDSILRMVRDHLSYYKYDLKSFVEDEEVFEYLIKLVYNGEKKLICRKHNTSKSFLSVPEVDDKGYEIDEHELATNIIDKLEVEYDTVGREILRGLLYIYYRNR